ncbi:hypothetical protein [Clostridium perfringens]|uniref:Uncharacterized protein n=1 Tax=Clostridium perfringens TaxID=1502 RepID=A0AAP4EGH7_CLOPF|nr:hypothetical protein [Clostridium perfringens]MDH2337354.1 hypothetical protein [Clostridium perfringens]
MAKTKKNLSLEEAVIQKGLKRAGELGFDFSAYVTYLINADTKKIKIQEEENVEKSCEKETEENDLKIPDDETLSEVDNILNGNV